TEPVVLKLRAAAAVDVTVVDGERGQPIAEARVEVRAPIVTSANTARDGAATLSPIIPGRWPLVVSAPGFATAFEAVTASPTAHSKVAVALTRGFHARGRVIDRAEKPVDGALVWLESASDWVSTSDPSRDGVRSSADGSFDVAGVARGSYVVSVIAPNRATATSAVVHVDHDVDGIVVRIVSDQQLAGRAVHRDRTPAPGAAVRVWWADGARVSHVDATGAFVIDGMPRSEIWISASDTDASSKAQRIDLSMGAPKELELVLENTASIAGMVVDQTGNPVEGAQVTGERKDVVDGNAATFRQGLSDSSGRFELRGLVAGHYQLSAVREPMSGAAGARVFVQTGQGDVRLVLESNGRIRGRVAFETGGAPAAYTVRVGRAGLPTAFTNESFEIESAPGARSLWIEGPGFTARSVDGLEVKADDVTDTGTIKLDRGRTLRGRVSAAQGVSVANAEVIAGALLSGTGQRVDSGDNGPSFRSDVKRTPVRPDGSFELTGVATTGVSVVATLDSNARSAPVAVPPGTADVDGIVLTVAREARLSGTVSRAGKPTRAIVNAQSYESPLAASTVMTQDGSYSFDRLAPGRYSVAAIAGAPLAGSPFYPRSVELAPSSAQTLDLTIAPGDSTLTVRAPGIAAGLVFVTTRPGTATSALALLTELGRQDGGQWAMTPVNDQTASFRELAHGPARVCVVQLTGKAAQASALVEQLARTGASLTASCVTTELGATTTVTIGGAANPTK
ncbi:MAG TPA: carboxypeptidase-like regulatory domain-containing protein, partial [Kofleriaceae bacterium]|nr:carboxypeptidase-like regulatory domain-containing protein [Kofleriaceae bacterium]